MKKSIVVGSGIGGIAAGIRLAAQGFNVSVLEASEQVGGKLAELRMQDFRFDKGPSLFTMPQYVRELFELHGKNIEQYFSYRKLDVVTQYFYEDGTRLTAHADPQQFKEALCEQLKESPKAVNAFFKQAESLYKITEPVFLQRSLHRASTYLAPTTWKSIAQLYKIDALRSMNRANEAKFRNPKTIQLFNRYATYNGSNPYEAPATLNVIAHLEHEIGAYFPKKGMRSIVQSLAQLATEVGVQFRTGEAAQEIMVAGKAAKGVRTAHATHHADLVVSNADIAHTYQKLLPSAPPPRRLLQQPQSSSALIFYWGMNTTFPELQLHNIFFSNAYKEEFEVMFKQGGISDDPTVYIFVSSKEVPEDAPQGQENWFVMVNAPHHAGQDWPALIARTREAIIKKLSRMLGKNIAPHIVCEEILDPPGIEKNTSSRGGSLYGNSSNSKWAAFMRHPNFFPRIQHLYTTGGSVHPGGGIPLCLLSAKIVGDLVSGKV